jgi:hypothetical protein
MGLCCNLTKLPVFFCCHSFSCQHASALQQWHKRWATAQKKQEQYKNLLMELDAEVRDAYEMCCQLAHRSMEAGRTPFGCQLNQLLKVSAADLGDGTLWWHFSLAPLAFAHVPHAPLRPHHTMTHGTPQPSHALVAVLCSIRANCEVQPYADQSMRFSLPCKRRFIEPSVRMLGRCVASLLLAHLSAAWPQAWKCSAFERRA